jgi:hypothetical protein
MRTKLEELDLFGKSIQLNIRNKELYRSTIGGLITIFIGILLVLATYSFGRDIIQRLKPLVITQTNQLPQYPYRNLNNSNIFLAVRPDGVNGKLLNNFSYFDISFTYFYGELDQNGSYQMKISDIQWLNNCNTSHIDEATFNQRNFKTFYCPNLGAGYPVGGFWDGNPNLGFFIFNLVACNADVEKRRGVKCASEKDKLEVYGNEFYFDIDVDDYLVDPSNFTAPFSRSIGHTYHTVDFSLYKIKELYYSISTVATDAGWILQEVKDEETLSLNPNSFFDFQPVLPDGSVFGLRIFLNKRVNTVSRKYIKVQDIFAAVGGFMKLAFLLAKALYHFFYLKIKFTMFYFDSLFEMYNVKNNSKNVTSNLENKQQFHILQNDSVNLKESTENVNASLSPSTYNNFINMRPSEKYIFKNINNNQSQTFQQSQVLTVLPPLNKNKSKQTLERVVFNFKQLFYMMNCFSGKKDTISLFKKYRLN